MASRTNPHTTLALYQLAVGLVATSLMLGLVAFGWTLGNAYVVIGLAIAACVAERSRVRIGATLEASISLLPTVFAAAVFGPLASMLIAVASFAGDFPPVQTAHRREKGSTRGEPYLKWGIYTAIRAITAGAAGIAAASAHHFQAQQVVRIILATVIAAFVSEGLDVAFVCFTAKLRGADVGDLVRGVAPVIFGYASFYTPIVALLAVAYLDLSPLTLPLFFVPALAAQRLFGLYQHQRTLTEDLFGANARLEAANLSFATALVATLEERDRYTAGHSAAVSIYARDIAGRLGLSSEEQRQAQLAGLVHDIGKIGLPAGLLEKPGALTLDERRQMEQHPVIGERILARVETYAEIAAAVRHHHERVDGNGYPDGLLGDDIPLIARIVAVADAYDAMTSDRPYRDAMPTRVARLRLAQAVASQFDTSVVAAFEAVLASRPEDYRAGAHPQFQLHGLDGVQDEPSSEPLVLPRAIAQESG